VRRRASWDETWLSVALVVSQRSLCVRQHGAVIVTCRNQILATGYNGPPRGMASERIGRPATCVDDCPRGSGRITALRVPGIPDYGQFCISVHAESNALLRMDASRADDPTLYVTGISCLDCVKLVSNSGIVRVIAIDDSTPQRPFEATRRLYARCGIEFDVMPAPNVSLIQP
jgi:dCMP deaminase